MTDKRGRLGDRVPLLEPETLSAGAAIAYAAATLALIGALDFLTGYEISFAVFYLLPAGLAAWHGGRAPGCVLALAASLVWFAAETGAGYPYSHPAIPIWNAFARFIFFVVVALLLATLRARLLSERRLANTDALTGALNARAFVEQLTHDMAVMRRVGSPLTLGYIDLDDFKRINDTYGHGSGDELLRAVARTLKNRIRRTDTLARLGGDEFALILPGTGPEGVEHLLALLGGALDELIGTDNKRVTWSMGAVVFDESPVDADAALDAADRLMYRAKSQGKNKVVVGRYRASEMEIVHERALMEPITGIEEPSSSDLSTP